MIFHAKEIIFSRVFKKLFILENLFEPIFGRDGTKFIKYEIKGHFFRAKRRRNKHYFGLHMIRIERSVILVAAIYLTMVHVLTTQLLESNQTYKLHLR